MTQTILFLNFPVKQIFKKNQKKNYHTFSEICLYHDKNESAEATNDLHPLFVIVYYKKNEINKLEIKSCFIPTENDDIFHSIHNE